MTDHLPDASVQRAYIRRVISTDIDHFRSITGKYRAHFTPLVRQISASATNLVMPGLEFGLSQSYPRLGDYQMAPNSTAILATMEDAPQIRNNGRAHEFPMVLVGHGNSAFSSRIDAFPNLISIVFKPEIRDRGWPAGSGLLYVPTRPEALQRLRILIPELLKFAIEHPEALQLPATTDGIRESLLAAVDDVLEGRKSLRSYRARQFPIMRQIDAILSENIAEPIYSGELAKLVGVELRTLHNIITQFRGMSPHRYLRLKRLWLAREKLIAGNTIVKVVALSCGFWHFGDFSRSYRAQFGETPSETLTRARKVH